MDKRGSIYNRALKMITIVDRRGTLPTHKTKTFPMRSMTDIEYIVVHHQAGTGPLENVARYHSGPNHICPKGCPGFCYHYHIDTDGIISLANDLTRTVWANGKVKRSRFTSPNHMKLWRGMNTPSVSIMLQGDFDGENHKGVSGNPTSNQIMSLIRLRWHLLDLFGLPTERFIGHCHINKRKCPGFNLQDLVESLWSKPATLYLPEPQEMKAIIETIKDTFNVFSH